MDQMGKGYRGTISQTNTGRTCQAWSSQVPHKHSYSDQLLDQKNYCRNADDEPYGPWCYTTDVNQRWEYCKIPYCGMQQIEYLFDLKLDNTNKKLDVQLIALGKLLS